MEIGGHVGAHDEEELAVGVLGDELLEGVGRVRLAPPLDLDGAGLDAFGAGDGGLDHGQPVGGGRDPSTALLPGMVGHHEQDAVEVQVVADVGRGDQMADVDRVEGPPENSQLFGGTALGDETSITEPAPGLYPCTDWP